MSVPLTFSFVAVQFAVNVAIVEKGESDQDPSATAIGAVLSTIIAGEHGGAGSSFPAVSIPATENEYVVASILKDENVKLLIFAG